MTCTTWPYEIPENCPPIPATVTGDELTVIEEAATELLWGMSGRRFGSCPVTVRPCKRECWMGFEARWPPLESAVVGSWGGTPWQPVLYSGNWYNVSCGCQGQCSCTHVESLYLPGFIQSVEAVVIGSTSLNVFAPDPAIAIDNGEYLTRLDGGMWPLCQDLNVDPPEEGAWAVSYTMGIPVPALGRLAMAELVYQMALAQCGDGKCQLPSAVSMINRRGVTIMFDLKRLQAGQRIGLPVSDQFIGWANPNGLTDGMSVWSPDLPKPPLVRHVQPAPGP